MIRYSNTQLQNRFIGDRPVGRVYKGTTLLWETKEGYGVRWQHDGGNVTITRIGNMEYHKTLPIQNAMRRCILKSDGSVQYIDESDYTKDTEGNTIDYTADNQDIMVEIPEHYYEAGQVTENGVVYDYIMLYPTVHLGKKVPKHYIGAFEAMTYNGDNNTPQSLWSTCKTNIVYQQDGSVDLGSLTYTVDAASYRGGNRNNSSYGDATDKSLLGKPATNITIANFATYGKARGDGYAMINWAAWNVLYRLYVVEYANFNSQATFNSALTSAGYRQGGLGDGVTNANSTNWGNEIGYNPYIPCGVTLKLGSNTGTVKCTLPSSIQNISTNTYVPSYRGVENPFGHIWQITSGISIYGYDNVNYIFTDNLGIYARDFITINSTTAPSGFTLKSSTTPLSSGYVSQIEFDESGEFMPKTVGSTSIFSDYFYGSNTGAKRLMLGGHSSFGSSAGLFCFGCYNGVGGAGANYGSRLLYIGNN